MGIKIFTTTLEKVRDQELKKLNKEGRTNITNKFELRNHKSGKVKMFVLRSEDAK